MCEVKEIHILFSEEILVENFTTYDLRLSQQINALQFSVQISHIKFELN